MSLSPDHRTESSPEVSGADVPATSSASSELSLSRDAAGQLWAGHFQHLGTLSLAAGAGVLLLLEAGFFTADWRLWTGLAGLVLATATAADGEFKVIDSFGAGPVPLSRLRMYRAFVWGFIALGLAGVFASANL